MPAVFASAKCMGPISSRGRISGLSSTIIPRECQYSVVAKSRAARIRIRVSHGVGKKRLTS